MEGWEVGERHRTCLIQGQEVKTRAGSGRESILGESGSAADEE